MSDLPEPSLRMLDPTDLELVEAARGVIDAATDAGPGEDGIHTMGAAVLADDGRVFVGVNLYDQHPGIPASGSSCRRPRDPAAS